MSEHEFERFLVILRGMLRLNPEQRDEIAAELMDHLQERLAELSRLGVPHEKAVQLALEDLGDAAGLAASFALVLSQQRRRRIMKWTAGSMTALVALLVMTYAFWSSQPAGGPAPRTAVAQEVPLGTGALIPIADAPGGETGESTAPLKPDAKSKPRDLARELESKLAETSAAEYKEVALQDFLKKIGDEASTDVYIDKAALEEVGIGVEMPITAQFKSIRRDRLLDLILEQHGLAWDVREGYFFVTTREKLEQTMETRVYNCRDLVGLAPIVPQGSMLGEAAVGAMGGAAPDAGMGMMPGMVGPGMSGMAGMPGMPGMGGASGMAGAMGGGMSSMEGVGMMPGGGFQSGYPMTPYTTTLIEVLKSTVLPESWSESGGRGSVAAYHGGLLVVSHHAAAHQKIEQLLRMLREAALEKPGSVVRNR